MCNRTKREVLAHVLAYEYQRGVLSITNYKHLPTAGRYADENYEKFLSAADGILFTLEEHKV